MDTAVRKKPVIPGEYYAIQNARKMMRTVPDLNGGYPTANTQPGSLFPDNDSRIDICNVTFDIKAKQVTSYSYDPEKMSCHCCGEFLARHGDKAGRQTFVLSDQNFPASLPSDNTGPKCLKILRIEGGRLGELVDKLLSSVHHCWLAHSPWQPGSHRISEPPGRDRPCGILQRLMQCCC